MHVCRYKRVIAFLPDFYLDYDYVANKKRMVRAGFEVKASAMPDNVSLLLSLRDEGLLVTTPSQDYDDTYTIEYALKHSACIVSNDKYFLPHSITQRQDSITQHQILPLLGTVTKHKHRTAPHSTNGRPSFRYRDHTEGLPEGQRPAMRRWFKHHLITFTFVGDEYLTIKVRNKDHLSLAGHRCRHHRSSSHSTTATSVCYFTHALPRPLPSGPAEHR
jgi:hypothetical protein